MHSSRMRTIRRQWPYLRGGVCSQGGICSGGCLLWGGGCVLWGEGVGEGLSPPGVSAPQGVGAVVSQHALRQTPPPLWTEEVGCLLWGGGLLRGRGVCLLWGDVCSLGGVCSWGGGIPAYTEADTPCGQTDACKNITFVTSLRTVKIKHCVL